MSTTTDNKGAMTDEEIRIEWRKAGGGIHGPNVETVTMPKAEYFGLRRSFATQPAQAVGFSIRHVDGRWRTLDSIGMPDWTNESAQALCFSLREHADRYAEDDPEDVRIIPVGVIAPVPAEGVTPCVRVSTDTSPVPYAGLTLIAFRSAHRNERLLTIRHKNGDTFVPLTQRRDYQLWEELVSLTAPEPIPVPAEGAKTWRCFHCDELFTDTATAIEHFGNDETQRPACEIDITEYRAMEELHRLHCDDDTDLHREIHALQAQHFTDLRREEEKGYAHGLRDAVTPAHAQVKRHLITLARETFHLLDNSEEREGDDGLELVVSRTDFDAVSAILDLLDELPDDQPGVTMGPAAKAEWALRDLFYRPIAAAPEPIHASDPPHDTDVDIGREELNMSRLAKTVREPEDDVTDADITKLAMEHEVYGTAFSSVIAFARALLAARPAPAEATVDDLASFVRQLVRSLRKAKPDSPLAARAMDYLQRHDLMGNVLRDSESVNKAWDRFCDGMNEPAIPVQLPDAVPVHVATVINERIFGDALKWTDRGAELPTGTKLYYLPTAAKAAS